jgi:uncharacterized protein YuzE
MRITFLPHALEQMRRRGISEEEARQVLEEPVEEGEANFGRFYAQKAIGHRRIRVVLQSWCRRDRGGLRHASQKGRWSVVKISHDKVSGALYFKLREGEYDHTEDYSEKADVYLDVDANGNVLGLEALSFEDLAEAIEESDGELGVPDRVLYLPEGAGEPIIVEIPNGEDDGPERMDSTFERVDGEEDHSERLRRRT